MGRVFSGTMAKDANTVLGWTLSETDTTDEYIVELGTRREDGFWHTYTSDPHLLPTPVVLQDVMQLVTDVMADADMDYMVRWGKYGSG